MKETDGGSKLQSYSKCLVIVTGIYTCFLSFGYFLEKLLKYKVNDAVEFKFPIFIVVVTSASNLVMSVLLLLAQYVGDLRKKKSQSGRQYRPVTRLEASKVKREGLFGNLERKHLLRLCLSSSFSIMAQMTATYALPYVGIPTQVIIKSSKMVPILIGGFVLFRKRYAWYDVTCVVSITLSIILFNFERFINYKDNRTSVLGIFLCFLSLFCDGFVGPIQDDVLSKVSLHPHFLMFISTMVSLPISLAACLTLEGLLPFMLVKNREIMKLALSLALSGTLGQMFVFLSITSYGSLYTGIITTLRKAFSTLLSVYIFKHSLTRVQWFALLTTFSSIFMQQFFKNKDKAVKKSK
ncbi:uncharacterized protein TOT_010001080 [Theileria orientalis strain Shintoku]|uniref:UDP-galactose transporter n=1 Tax=Theileria orientalis strain Shintoku TaxID=869250 RepID=J4C310_THEOR|nr:uncharacterized protein TOT_010001080 [Theileria orientalis strain Shintoku]PVC49595.1 hypothetical protein MACL_00002941 [Theileria orientalis]BAM39626.1 uncharacterized protein TOT_010001080 [Theileria orientalis strain Shintoku]|eukprot:XP_009689927.1 uncharacterized protein TOT_010001080 [Theileria orientalis strain Shintoku]